VDVPLYSFMIANRQNLNDFIEPITDKVRFKYEPPYIFLYKPSGTIKGVWFYGEDECLKIYNLLNLLRTSALENPAKSIALPAMMDGGSANEESDENRASPANQLAEMTISGDPEAEKKTSLSSQTGREPKTEIAVPPSAPSTIVVDAAPAVSSNVVVGLTKDQLLQALHHLLDTDEEFMNKIHKAYADSLIARLKK